MFWAAHGLHCEVQQASYPGPIGLGNLLNSSRDRDRLLQLLVFNEEFLVNASHQLALITSLPFVHTARRSYRLDESMSLSEESRETTSVVDLQSKVMQICSSRGRRSRNKVSVGEPAEGSLTQNNPKNQRKPPFSVRLRSDETHAGSQSARRRAGPSRGPHGVGPFHT
jgi:hypothetical protein